MGLFALLLVFVLAAGVTGCAAPHPFDVWRPGSTPLAPDQAVYVPPIDPSDRQRTAGTSPVADPVGTLTLEQVIRLVLIESPELAGFALQVRAAEARAVQVSLLPNPQVGVEVENVAGGGELSGFDAAETTISFSQVFPLGGKIGRRTDLAVLERDVAGWDYETRRTQVLVEATRRFVDVLAAQRQIQLTQESQRLATLVHQTVTTRVDAGDVAPTETARTGVLLAMSRIEVQRAQRMLQVARGRLAETWGSAVAGFESAIGSLDQVVAVPSFEALDHWINENPQMAKWATQLHQRRAAVALAQAEGVPDLELQGGIRYLNESDDAALVVGISLPLPIFDRRQGDVLEARYQLADAHLQRQAVTVRLRVALSAAYHELVANHAEVTALRDDVLPAAGLAFQAAQSAFNQGGGGYLDMLDAQRTLTQVQRQHVDALARYHRAVAEVEGLIGRPMRSLTPSNPAAFRRQNHGDFP